MQCSRAVTVRRQKCQQYLVGEEQPELGRVARVPEHVRYELQHGSDARAAGDQAQLLHSLFARRRLLVRSDVEQAATRVDQQPVGPADVHEVAGRR